MPLQKCTVGKRTGYKWGKSGKCYVGPRAKKKATRQSAAIRASGYVENQVLNQNGHSKPTKRTEVSATNPFKIDPTRTATLRRRFMAEFNKRFLELKSKIIELVVKEDAFGLRQTTQRPLGNVTANTRFAFRTSPEQVQLFREWLGTQVDAGILTISDVNAADDAYFAAYVEDGYRKGAGRAFDDTRRLQQAAAASAGSEQLAGFVGTREEFLRAAFARPVAINKVKLLAGRVFTELRGVTEFMAQRMTRELAGGLVRGENPRTVARALNKAVDLGRKRSLAVARTESVRAFSEGQLDSLEQLGVTKLGVMVEWTAAKVGACELCISLDGVVLKISEAKGMIPRHVNCRCAFRPANVGESTKGQTRGKAKVEKSIRRSLSREIPGSSARTVADQRAITSWTGADTNISPLRPVPVVSQSLTGKAWDTAGTIMRPVAQIGNIWPNLAQSVVREAGFSERVVKAAMFTATAADFALPGVPAGSWAITALASIRSPLAPIRVLRNIFRKVKRGVKVKLTDIRRGV